MVRRVIPASSLGRAQPGNWNPPPYKPTVGDEIEMFEGDEPAVYRLEAIDVENGLVEGHIERWDGKSLGGFIMSAEAWKEMRAGR